MIETLGEFDRQVAEELFAVHPEWQEFARAVDDNGENALVVSLKSPNLNIKAPLVITTEDLQVSVFFDHYHGHFDALKEGALSLVEKFISDRYCIVTYWRDSQLCWSHFSEWSSAPSTNADFPYANKMIFRSWSGNHDNEITCVGRG